MTITRAMFMRIDHNGWRWTVHFNDDAVRFNKNIDNINSWDNEYFEDPVMFEEVASYIMDELQICNEDAQHYVELAEQIKEMFYAYHNRHGQKPVVD